MTLLFNLSIIVLSTFHTLHLKKDIVLDEDLEFFIWFRLNWHSTTSTMLLFEVLFHEFQTPI
jgi:hypothetical protein